MAYFRMNDDGNFEYSYYGVHGWIEHGYAAPVNIEAYFEEKMFYEAVKNSYQNLDLSRKRDLERFNAKMEKTADWLRMKVHWMYF
jgi:hypothetical protein